MNEEQIREIVREEMESTLGYVFSRHIQLLDGRNLQLGKTTGTKIGLSSSEKIGLWGTTPVIQRTKINDPNDVSGTYVSAEVQDIVDKVKAILDALETIGITASV